MAEILAAVFCPENPREAHRLLLRFAVHAVERLQLTFPASPNDPLTLARAYLAGTASDADMRAARDYWWDFIFGRQGLAAAGNEDALRARLALYLTTDDVDSPLDMDENLSWFCEFVRELGLDLDVVHALLRQWPDFADAENG